jgi:IS30 family transposase
MISEEEIQAVFQKLNLRPRKCLGFKTPFEVFYNLSLLLHLT